MTALHHTISTAITPRQLLSLAHLFSDEAQSFTFDPTSPERQWKSLTTSDQVQIWAIAWPPGSSNGWHDHGFSVGALLVVQGELTEHAWHGYETISLLPPGAGRHYPDSHIHDLRNESAEWALSVHAYFPRLEHMSRYALQDGQLVVTGTETEGAHW